MDTQLQQIALAEKMQTKVLALWEDSKSLNDIRKAYAKNATDTEFNMLIEMGRATALNPFLREIWLVKYGNGAAQIFIGRDGYRIAAQRQPDYDYHLVDAVYSNDKFQMWNGEVQHQYEISNRGNLIGAYCVVKRKSATRTMYVFVEFPEYDLKQGLWKTKPATMIKKCFDSETEVLTDLGFQRFDSVTGNILQISEKNGLEKTSSIPFSQEYHGEMIQYDGQYLNFSVTPNHTMITANGKIDAEDLFKNATKCYRDAKKIPSNFIINKNDYEHLSDAQLKLAAYFICDGYYSSSRQFRLSVSRHYKIQSLNNLNLHTKLSIKKGKGYTSKTESRNIVTSQDYHCYSYDFSLIDKICFKDKTLNKDVLFLLSQRQAKVLMDALIEFDGSISTTGTKRFYTSRMDILKQTELLAVLAGYAVNVPSARCSDISKKPNYFIAISEKKYYPVVSHMEKKPGIIKTSSNIDGKVWCVTVPSGMIIVRRNGFSMVCGNCAEAQAIRMAFQSTFAGTYAQEELPEERSRIPEDKVASKQEIKGNVYDSDVMISQDQIAKIDDLMMLGDISYERLQSGMRLYFKKVELQDLTEQEASELIERLEKKVQNEITKEKDIDMEVKATDEQTKQGADSEEIRATGDTAHNNNN